MVDSSIQKQVLAELSDLPADLQRRVLDYARSLTRSQPKGVAGKDLLAFAGVMEKGEALAMTRAIEAECERVEPDGW